MRKRLYRERQCRLRAVLPGRRKGVGCGWAVFFLKLNGSDLVVGHINLCTFFI